MSEDDSHPDSDPDEPTPTDAGDDLDEDHSADEAKDSTDSQSPPFLPDLEPLTIDTSVFEPLTEVTEQLEELEQFNAAVAASLQMNFPTMQVPQPLLVGSVLTDALDYHAQELAKTLKVVNAAATFDVARGLATATASSPLSARAYEAAEVDATTTSYETVEPPSPAEVDLNDGPDPATHTSDSDLPAAATGPTGPIYTRTLVQIVCYEVRQRIGSTESERLVFAASFIGTMATITLFDGVDVGIFTLVPFAAALSKALVVGWSVARKD